VIILGINAFHGDSSAALIRDGVLIAAAEEERFRRIKHWAGFPSESIAYCLREAGVSASDVDHLAVNQDDHAHFFRKMAFLITTVPDFRLVLDRLKKRRDRQSLPDLLAKAFHGQRFRGVFHAVEHHVAHSRKPQLFHWTGLEIFPAPHGALVLART
jgi:carbamoyltransferase